MPDKVSLRVKSPNPSGEIESVTALHWEQTKDLNLLWEFGKDPMPRKILICSLKEGEDPAAAIANVLVEKDAPGNHSIAGPSFAPNQWYAAGFYEDETTKSWQGMAVDFQITHRGIEVNFSAPRPHETFGKVFVWSKLIVRR